MASLIRHHIKYVFVLYQENRSFDSYFGTFPGADDIYSQQKLNTPGFSQPIIGILGKTEMIESFRIGPKQNAADTDDIDHSHPIMFAKIVDAVSVCRRSRPCRTSRRAAKLVKKSSTKTMGVRSMPKPPGVTNLFFALDPSLPTSYAEVPRAWADDLPSKSGADCEAIGIVPTDIKRHLINPIPKDFNSRPKSTLDNHNEQQNGPNRLGPFGHSEKSCNQLARWVLI